MTIFEISDLVHKQAESGRTYFEFLRESTCSAGIYQLRAGGVDVQSPHMEDEIYYVVEGEARVTVGEDTRSVRSGTMVFVPVGIEHRFHDITADLTLLVFFAPAEYSASQT